MSVAPDITVSQQPLSVAIVAMGGQGGGVLADWIASVARAGGYTVQATSVAGVAQRTGATIYYIELMRPDVGRSAPVLALMPTPGDVDVVIASELMEAGRAILRGLVTPERTTLIASAQRALAISEKEKPGDGVADSGAVHAASEVVARRRIVGDFARVADEAGSVISASLLGALAASEALPFGRDQFEAAIRSAGVGIEASLRAFARGHDLARATPVAVLQGTHDRLPPPPQATGVAALDALLTTLRAVLPAPVHGMAYAGVRHLVDYQDPAYAEAYLETLGGFVTVDRAAGGDAHSYHLTTEIARHLARALAYDDVIRVADLKIRKARSERVAGEHRLDPSRQLLRTTEFFHPRMDEVCATLPAGIGAAIERRPRLFSVLDRVVNRGRRVRTDTITGYLQLYVIAGRKPKRRGTLRHGREMVHIDRWLASVRDAAPKNYALAVELATARRLVKGYSDTMARGLSKFDRVMAGAQSVSHRADAADWVKRLHLAALADEDGATLDGALRTLASLDQISDPNAKTAPATKAPPS